MNAHINRHVRSLLEQDFIRFCIVGGTGFVLNLLILLLLSRIAHLPIFIAQLIGAEIALFSNFILHDRWTYRKKRSNKSISTLLLQFHATSWPAIIGSSLMVTGAVRYLHFSKLLALAMSSSIALVWNFVWSKFVIWKDASINDIRSAEK